MGGGGGGLWGLKTQVMNNYVVYCSYENEAIKRLYAIVIVS